MKEKQPSKKELELLKSLESEDSKIVLRAIKSAKVSGTQKVFEGIVNLILDDKQPNKVQSEIISFLHDLKSSDALLVVIEAIKDPKFEIKKPELISTFWNSPLNPNAFISLFVKEAIKGNYMTALECSTVLDNIEPPFPEEEVNESILLLKDYFSKHPDEPKTELLKDILIVIKEMEQSVNLS